MSDARPGEVALSFDPAARAEARVAVIGRVRTPWGPGDCPRNLRTARERGGGARVVLEPAYRAGCAGLEPGRWVMLLTFMDGARRDLVVQAPRHVDGPRGVFALRSPVRPNPVALACVRIEAMRPDGFDVDAMDCFDGTPLLDVKPWVAALDAPFPG